jgi:hypothetical protein
MAASKKSKNEIQPHSVVAALQPDPQMPPQRTVRLLGFPGDGPTTKILRLWQDLDFANYVDIPRDAILHHALLSKDDEDAGTVVWVAADTQLTYATTAEAGTLGSFLSGNIASQHLPAAAPGSAQSPAAEQVPAFGSLPLLHCPVPSKNAPCNSSNCVPPPPPPPPPPHQTANTFGCPSMPHGICVSLRTTGICQFF